MSSLPPRPSPPASRLSSAAVAALLLGLGAVVAAPMAAAAECNDDAAAELSVRPHALTRDPGRLLSGEVAGKETPYDEQRCDAPCPSKPALVLWAEPKGDQLVHAESCAITMAGDEDQDLLIAFYRHHVTVDVDGGLGVTVEDDRVDEEPYNPELVFDDG